MKVALILSGGRGTRLGADIPKQYITAGGRPVISYCMERLFGHEEIDGVQIAAAPEWWDMIRELVKEMDRENKFRGFSLPGETRQLSILNGLNDIRRYGKDTDYVLIHDAARPLLSGEQIGAVLRGALGHDGAIPVLPMKDTIYRSRDGRTLSGLLNRDEVYAGQAPEVFRLGAYYEANRRLLPEGIRRINGSTEPAVMAGLDIAMIPGDEANFKITTKADMERFQRIIETKGF